MAAGHIQVRNACPFPVTFYALAGPTIELAPYQTQRASACLIWFSTRVKGAGDAIDMTAFEERRDEYAQNLANAGHDSADWEEGGSGEAAGSFLGLAVGELSSVFKVKNTEPDDNTLCFGAKKEAVYGNSNLVVYATLDPACKLDPQPNPPQKWWYLHLETDHGQVTPPDDTEPAYVKPDLSQYADGFFFRLRSQAHGGLMFAQSSQMQVQNVSIRQVDSPFNPLTTPEYWSMHPEPNADSMALRILNTSNNSWLTDFSQSNSFIGQVSFGTYDYEDQHWVANSVSDSPRVIELANSAAPGYALVWNSKVNKVFLYPPGASGGDQNWQPETFFVNIEDLPEGVPFRIMHAYDGKYITYIQQAASLELFSYVPAGGLFSEIANQLFTLKRMGNAYMIIDSVGRVVSGQPDGSLHLLSENTTSPQACWIFNTDSSKAGFYMVSQNPSPYGGYLYYNNGWGMYHPPGDDQLWVAQI